METHLSVEPLQFVEPMNTVARPMEWMMASRKVAALSVAVNGIASVAPQVIGLSGADQRKRIRSFFGCLSAFALASSLVVSAVCARLGD